MKIKNVTLAVPALLVFALSGCSAGGAAESSENAATCVFVTTPYSNWVASGGNTESSTGKLGREATLAAISSAEDELFSKVSLDDLTSARYEFQEKQSEFTRADLLASIIEFQSNIETLENLSTIPWTAGETSRIDEAFQKIQSICGELSK